MRQTDIERLYLILQDRMSKKLVNKRCLTNKESAYNEGVLACKSILSSEFKDITEKRGTWKDA